MAEVTKQNEGMIRQNGLFVRGIVLSNAAKVFNKKDGTGQVVCVRYEIALQPGLAVYEIYPEINGTTVKVQGETVLEFPKLPELQPITLKVNRWTERDGKLVVKEAEKVV